MEREPLHVEVVAADRQVWKGDAVNIIVRTTEGDIGILPGHEPILAALVPCAATIITNDGKQEVIAVDGGFIAVNPGGRVSILAQYASTSDEFSVEEAQRVLDETRRKRDRNEETDEDVHRWHLAKAQMAASRKLGRTQE
ncbi:F0F1 ATP synthase subunit epsilon [Acidipropionibacterium timonense]|uniref:F0F1 ATP synthase subunit epsilon n=1 Tax=Acidipropionibacterium timonense TaxID=2161818 RepID=UPI0010304CA3|nr:F0F1 ATP synthase subunit epsilon [Acidipropionibacterium timonense]